MQAFDLLIVGGGINGAAIARDAAGRGLSVCLVEAGDPGGATSWASSKLIHGGLRYLEQYAFGLVRESLAERAILLRIAPHLTRPCRFILPHTPQQRPAWLIRTGLWLYDHLGGAAGLPAASHVRLDDGNEWGQPLKPGLREGFSYFDVQVDDARLVILTLRDAAAHGASIHAGCRFLGASRHDALWQCRVQHGTSNSTLQARAIVNAAGPWVAEVLSSLCAAREHRHPGVQLVRGSHIVVPRCYAGDHAYTLQNDDGRVLFLLPFHADWTLIGTTDVRTNAPDPAPQPSPAEVAYLLHAANRYLARPLAESDIVWRFAGLRPLYDDGRSNPSAITRDYRLVLEQGRDHAPPAVSVFGGKLTTHRHLAEAVMAQLKPWFPHLPDSWTATMPLPGGDGDFNAAAIEYEQAFAHLPEVIRHGLWARHGTRAFDLLADIGSSDDLGRDFGGGLCELEASHFIRHEWARHGDDILWRRSKAGLAMTPVQRQSFNDWFASQHKEQP